MVTGDYELQVTIHSFSNPEGQCASQACLNREECCNGQTCPNSCDYYFSLCQRPAGADVMSSRKRVVIEQELCLNSSIRNTAVQTATDGYTYGDTSSTVTFMGAMWVRKLLLHNSAYCMLHLFSQQMEFSCS